MQPLLDMMHVEDDPLRSVLTEADVTGLITRSIRAILFPVFCYYSKQEGIASHAGEISWSAVQQAQVHSGGLAKDKMCNA